AALIAYRLSDQALNEALFPKLAALPAMSARLERAWRPMPVETLFGAAPTQSLEYPQTRGQDWTAFFGSACGGVEALEPGDPEFATFEAINREAFERFAMNGELERVYVTSVVLGPLG